MALVTGFGNSLRMVRSSRGLGVAKAEEAAEGTDSPLPRGSVLPLSQAQPGQERGTGVRAASLGPGEGLGLLGPRSGPQ